MTRGLVAALVAVLLSGCGQRSSATQSGSGVSGPAAAASDSPASEDSESAAAPTDVPTSDPAAVDDNPGAGIATPGASEPAVTETPVATGEPTQQPTGPAPDPAARLWNRNYASTRIIENGRRKPHGAGVRMKLRLTPRRHRDEVHWDGADCNGGGGYIKVTATHFDVGQLGASTQVYCPPKERFAQEHWLTEFMTADPAWTASDDGTRLRLETEDAVVHWAAQD